MPTLGLLRDSTAERFRDLIAAVRAGRAHHVLIRASTTGLLTVASCALLTAWNELIRTAEGSWPLCLSLEKPLPIDLDDLLDRALAEQRVTSDRTVADALFSDEESVPVVCCGENVALSDVQHVLYPLFVRKRHCIVLVGEMGSKNMSPLLRSKFKVDETLSFPRDFQSPDRPTEEEADAVHMFKEHASPCPLWKVTSVSAIWVHPDSRVLIRVMKQYPGPPQLRALAQGVGFDVSRVLFNQELERAAHDLVEKAFSADQLKAIISAMYDDPVIRHWRDDLRTLLERER